MMFNINNKDQWTAVEKKIDSRLTDLVKSGMITERDRWGFRIDLKTGILSVGTHKEQFCAPADSSLPINPLLTIRQDMHCAKDLKIIEEALGRPLSSQEISAKQIQF